MDNLSELILKQNEKDLDDLIQNQDDLSQDDEDYTDILKSDTEIAFENAAVFIRRHAGQMSKDNLLYFYGRFKFITDGVCNTPRPTGMLNFEAKSKWDSWKCVSGECGDNKEKAMEEYISKLESINSEWRSEFDESAFNKNDKNKKKSLSAEEKGSLKLEFIIHYLIINSFFKVLLAFE
jgi:acyl-CoA-binding protein